MSETVDTDPVEEAAGAKSGAEAEEDEPRRKRSRSLRDVQRIERRLSKAALHMTHAVAEGLETYRRERDLSAERTRDGALVEMPVNVAKGLAATLEKSSRIPVDVARAFDTRTTRRAIRLGAKMLLWPLRR